MYTNWNRADPPEKGSSRNCLRFESIWIGAIPKWSWLHAFRNYLPSNTFYTTHRFIHLISYLNRDYNYLLLNCNLITRKLDKKQMYGQVKNKEIDEFPQSFHFTLYSFEYVAGNYQ